MMSMQSHFTGLALLLGLALWSVTTQVHPESHDPVAATFSIVAFDPESGELGVAVQSKFFGVGSVVPWAKAGVGAIATQASVNVSFGPEGLVLLESGQSARETVEALTQADSGRDHRQIGIVDAEGNPAGYTGEKCLDWAGHFEGNHFSVQGNLLANEEVIQAMARAYLKAQEEPESQLADWLMAALSAGQEAGGDKRGQQSASLLVVREQGGLGRATDRFIDLRVEDHPEPVEELARLLEIHKNFFPGLHKKRAQQAGAVRQ